MLYHLPNSSCRLHKFTVIIFYKSFYDENSKVRNRARCSVIMLLTTGYTDISSKMEHLGDGYQKRRRPDLCSNISISGNWMVHPLCQHSQIILFIFLQALADVACTEWRLQFDTLSDEQNELASLYCIPTMTLAVPPYTLCEPGKCLLSSFYQFPGFFSSCLQ